MWLVPCTPLHACRPLGYGNGGRDRYQFLSESLLLCQPWSTSLTLMSCRLSESTSRKPLVGGEGIHVLHQFDPLVLQVFQQFVH